MTAAKEKEKAYRISQFTCSKTHIECGPGEVYLWNMADAQFDELEYKSKRKGVVCIGEKGTPVDLSGFFPVFISDDEDFKHKQEKQ